MLFVAVCLDKPGGLETRLETRPAHLAWLEGLGARLKLAGPFLKDDRPVGSMLIAEAEDEADAAKLFAGDPYIAAGLFASVDVRPWRLVKGALG
jgi:uncharacterized protein YciI